MGVGHPLAPQIPHGPLWASIVRDLRRYPGYLSEVILDAHQDPGPFLETLARAHPGAVAVEALCLATPDGGDTWQSVRVAADRFRVSSETDTLVYVVDPSVVAAVSDVVSVFDPATSRYSDGPWLANWGPYDSIPVLVKATGYWLHDVLAEWRSICERTGLRIVVVSVDARPERGRGDLVRTHFFTDSRVRSHIGDAGRHCAHLRYLVDTDRSERPRRVVMLKDEGEGLMGRLLWSRWDRDSGDSGDSVSL